MQTNENLAATARAQLIVAAEQASILEDDGLLLTVANHRCWVNLFESNADVAVVLHHEHLLFDIDSVCHGLRLLCTSPFCLGTSLLHDCVRPLDTICGPDPVVAIFLEF